MLNARQCVAISWAGSSSYTHDTVHMHHPFLGLPVRNRLLRHAARTIGDML